MASISHRLANIIYKQTPSLRPTSRAFTSQSRPRLQNLTAVQQHIEQHDVDEDIDLKLEDHGVYDIVFPEDPLAAPTRRSPTRHVPPHIARPPYVPTTDLTQRIRQMRESVMPKSSIIRLGGDEERKLREAARLAEQTLKYAGTLVQVCVSYL